MEKFLYLLISILFLASCSSNDKAEPENNPKTIETVVSNINVYGNLIVGVSSNDLFEAGYKYGDMVHVEVGNLKMNMPFVDVDMTVGSWGICLNQYSDEQYLTLALANASFHDRVGGNAGDKVLISIYQKEGFLETYNKLNMKRSDNRDDYSSDEVFANFRMVTAGDIAEDRLYRSSKPTMNKSNVNRYLYADKLARAAGIKTMIALSDSQERWESENNAGNGIGSYSMELYNNDCLFLSAMGVDLFQSDNLKKLHDAIIYINNHDPPYLVFCDLGKDRTGLLIMLTELILNATYKEIEYDYMKSYDNFYGINESSSNYQVIKSITLDKLLYIIYKIGDVDIIKFNEMQSFNVDEFYSKLSSSAKTYFIDKVGITETELTTYLHKLSL